MIKFNKDQIFIVTGASSGIGEGTALLLNELGATVVAIARNEARLNGMKAKCKYPENTHIEIKDLTEDINNLPQYVKELKNKYGKFSGMAYCAGVSDIKPVSLLELDYVEKMFKIDYYAPLFFTKGILDRRNNIGRGTSIVAISSYAALINHRGMTIYSSAKAALISSYKCIANEMLSQGIRVNTVSPSDISTPLTENPEVRANRMLQPEDYPWGFGTVSDVANFIVFLLSDLTKWITRQDYIIDCGGGSYDK